MFGSMEKEIVLLNTIDNMMGIDTQFGIAK